MDPASPFKVEVLTGVFTEAASPFYEKVLTGASRDIPATQRVGVAACPFARGGSYRRSTRLAVSPFRVRRFLLALICLAGHDRPLLPVPSHMEVLTGAALRPLPVPLMVEVLTGGVSVGLPVPPMRGSYWRL